MRTVFINAAIFNARLLFQSFDATRQCRQSFFDMRTNGFGKRFDDRACVLQSQRLIGMRLSEFTDTKMQVSFAAHRAVTMKRRSNSQPHYFERAQSRKTL